MGKIIKGIVLTLLFLTLSASTAYLAYLHFFAPAEEDLSGEWTADLDMTGHAALAAFDWLRDIEAVPVSYEEVERRMGRLTVKVNLTLEETERSEGPFDCHILPESYEICNQAAYEAFAGVFRELLAERLHMADYSESTDEEAIEALVNETFGMSTVSYLMSCGPALLPPLEELQAEYDGGGIYAAEEDILIRRFDTGGAVHTKMEYYIRKDSDLILSAEADANLAFPEETDAADGDSALSEEADADLVLSEETDTADMDPALSEKADALGADQTLSEEGGTPETGSAYPMIYRLKQPAN